MSHAYLRKNGESIRQKKQILASAQAKVNEKITSSKNSCLDSPSKVPFSKIRYCPDNELLT